MKFNASTSTNFPLDGEGATYHVATKAGQGRQKVLSESPRESWQLEIPSGREELQLC